MSKRILVACGTAIATSTHVAERLKEICRQNGIEVEIIQARVQEVPAYMETVDLIVATTHIPFATPVPVLSGIPFLTGVGQDQLIAEILRVLRS